MNYLYLFIAILCEVTSTSFMKASEGFTKPIPTLISIFGFAFAIYLLSLAVRTIPIGFAYATWSGIGIVLTVLLAWFFYNQKPDFYAILGMAFIIIGVLIVNLLSKMSSH